MVCPISFLKKVVLWNTLTTNASITLTILTKTTPEHWSAAPVWAGGKNRLLWKSHTRLGTASTVTHFNRPRPIVVIIITITIVITFSMNFSCFRGKHISIHPSIISSIHIIKKMRHCGSKRVRYSWQCNTKNILHPRPRNNAPKMNCTIVIAPTRHQQRCLCIAYQKCT